MHHANKSHGGGGLWNRSILTSTYDVENSWFDKVLQHELLSHLRNTRYMLLFIEVTVKGQQVVS